MAEGLSVATSELILGGQKSGKSRRAELLARDWLAQAPDHKAVLIATGQPWDDEMRQRIVRHQRDRAERVPGMTTVEEPLALAEVLSRNSNVKTLVVVDCLTLWLTNLLMPAEDAEKARKDSQNAEKSLISNEKMAAITYSWAETAMLLIAIEKAAGPVTLVGNEIGLGVIPLGRETRVFVDALGQLNQNIAAVCQRVTLMVAGLPLTLKGQP